MEFSLSLLETWLTKECKLSHYQIDPLVGDASFRRYFRVHSREGSYIAMDARLEKASCVPFTAIAKTLRQQGLYVPEIIASDLEQGLLLLTDFGDRCYLNELNISNVEILYRQALDALSFMQSCRIVPGWTLKLFDNDFMCQELNLFKEWFLIKHLSLTLSEATNHRLMAVFAFLAKTASDQPYVFMHRDYHSANLMRLPDDQIGILDFQDAFIGPVTYDLVSLLRDCYIAWPPDKVTSFVHYYWKKLELVDVNFADFLRWFDLMGIQRHLKALLTFSRKYQRDGNPHYLQHIPRTLNYILEASQKYAECEALHDFLQDQVIEKCVP